MQLQASNMNLFTGIQDLIHLGILQSQMTLQAMALKAKKSKDPDLPSTREALTGPYVEEF
jgi:hypothetical protein